MLRLAALCLVLLLSLAPRAEAQFATVCPTYDTTVDSDGAATITSDCTLNSGIFGDLAAIITGEVTCGPLSDAEFNMFTGATAPGFPPPPTGANFNGSIASGVLTVSSMVTPTPQFPILTGMSLYDGSSGSNIPIGHIAQGVLISSPASPTVVSWFAHGFSVNQPIIFTNTGADVLPSPLVANTPYYVIAAGLMANSFEISATSGGAAINTTGSQSGTHTGSSILTVTGQIDGMGGGVGHYSVSDNTVTVSSELMWALPTYSFGSGPPNSLQISRDTLEHLVCQNGKTSIVTMAGVVRSLFFGPHFNLWVQILFTAAPLGGQPSQSASWKNGHIVLFTPGHKLGGMVQ